MDVKLWNSDLLMEAVDGDGNTGEAEAGENLIPVKTGIRSGGDSDTSSSDLGFP